MKLKKSKNRSPYMTPISNAPSDCKKEKIGKWSGLTRSELLKVIVQSVLACSVIALFVVFFCIMIKDLTDTTTRICIRDTAVEETYDGIIVDKRIENARSNVFRTVPTEYRLYIDVDYEVDGEKRTTQKYFSVPESTYLAYNIGDYFDSRNFFISNGQVS